MPTPLDSIDTIVVVMLENRSFDHVLGFLSHESFDGRTDVDGLHHPSDDFDCDNPDANGKPYAPTATSDSYLPFDMPHGRKEIADQLNKGAMDGFVKSYISFVGDRSPVPMRFCDPDDIPVTAALARNYTVCDQWHACLPDDTFPNRLMSLCGYTNIDDTAVVKPLKGELMPDQRTIFDWLKTRNRTFRIYVDADPIANLGPPASMLLMKNQWLNVIPNARTLDALATDWQSPERAPDVIYCEPFFNDFATAIGVHGNCNHPPLPMSYGETFLRKVYNSLIANSAKWARTMLIVCYDEHGGFFDHVPPPKMHYGPPADSKWCDTTPFETLGVRIPGIIISPLVEHASVYKGLLDHTSILQLMVEKFGSPEDLDTFGDASNRKKAGVQSLSATLTRSEPRANDWVSLPVPPPPTGPATTPAVSQVAQIFRALMRAAPKLALKL